MATERKQPLRFILDSRRDKGKSLDNFDVAKWLWQKVEEKFNYFSGIELEQIEYICIEFVEHINGLSITVKIKDAITKSDTKIKILTEALLVSAEKLQNIDEIMTFVRGMAKQNQLEFYDYTENDDILVLGEEKYWWVMWINSDIKL